MSWFKRSEKGIRTKTEEKKDIPKSRSFPKIRCSKFTKFLKSIIPLFLNKYLKHKLSETFMM